jgi:hypothetical protein
MFQLISEIRSLSADCLPSRIKASFCGVSASQFFGRSGANFPLFAFLIDGGITENSIFQMSL